MLFIFSTGKKVLGRVWEEAINEPRAEYFKDLNTLFCSITVSPIVVNEMTKEICASFHHNARNLCPPGV